MTVLLVSNYLADRQHSMLGFADCLQRELPSFGLHVRRLAPAVRLGRLPGPAKLRKYLAYVDKYVLFPSILRRAAAQADLVHLLDHGNAMLVPHFRHRPHLVTCHDLLAVRAAQSEIPNWPIGPSGRKYQALILKGLGRARAIAAVSEATRADVLRLTSVPPKDVSLVMNGMYQALAPHALETARAERERIGVDSPYLLHVGGEFPYKNREGARAIFHRVAELSGPKAPALVMVGPPGPETPGVRYVDSPSAAILTALYQGALGLVFPSWHEGFGLPILEAQTFGCPVFTSNRIPMTEVGGVAARYFDPADPEDAAQVVLNGLADADAMRQAGLENVRRFTASRMAADYVALYRELATAPATAAQPIDPGRSSVVRD